MRHEPLAARAIFILNSIPRAGFSGGYSKSAMFTPDRRLQKLYERYNDLYFDGELPSDVAVGWMDFPKRKPLAETGTLDGDGIIHHMIYMNEFLKPFRGAITKWI